MKAANGRPKRSPTRAWPSTIDIDWHTMLEEYGISKRVEGLRGTSIYEAMLMLRRFVRLVGPCSSGQFGRPIPDRFVLERSREVTKDTLNKDIRNLSTFLNWAARNRFLFSGLRVKEVRVSQKPVSALSEQQVRDVLVATSPHSTLRLRVLLAVTTGLRRGDIEAICIGDLHFDRNTITTRSRKAREAMSERPGRKDSLRTDSAPRGGSGFERASSCPA